MPIDEARANLAAAIVDLHPHANANYRIRLALAIEAMIDAKIGAQHPSVPLILTGIHVAGGAAPMPDLSGTRVIDPISGRDLGPSD
jgi:hypothetical protein